MFPAVLKCHRTLIQHLRCDRWLYITLRDTYDYGTHMSTITHFTNYGVILVKWICKQITDNNNATSRTNHEVRRERTEKATRFHKMGLLFCVGSSFFQPKHNTKLWVIEFEQLCNLQDLSAGQDTCHQNNRFGISTESVCLAAAYGTHTLTSSF